jgi:hypothetical protein
LSCGEDVSDELTLYLDGCLGELPHRSVGTSDRREGVEEDGWGWERDLEGVATRRLHHEGSLPSGWRVDLLKRCDDLVNGQLDVLASVVTEGHGLACSDARYGIVERVHEHPTPELAVRHDVESDVDLTPNDVADGCVLELTERRSVLLPLLSQDGRVPSFVEGVDRLTQ